MPVPFLDLAGSLPDNAVAYLRFVDQPDAGALQGAILVINAMGDPLEFCFTRVSLPAGPLWLPGQTRRQGVAALSKALFEAVNRLPDLVLALAEETPSEVFVEDMEVQVPVCLVGSHADPSGESRDAGQVGSVAVSLRWVAREPSDGSDLSRLVESLKSRRLLLEPFERASQGLKEALNR